MVFTIQIFCVKRWGNLGTSTWPRQRVTELERFGVTLISYCNGYRLKKWNWRQVCKSLTWLFGFYAPLMPVQKA